MFCKNKENSQKQSPFYCKSPPFVPVFCLVWVFFYFCSTILTAFDEIVICKGINLRYSLTLLI